MSPFALHFQSFIVFKEKVHLLRHIFRNVPNFFFVFIFTHNYISIMYEKRRFTFIAGIQIFSKFRLRDFGPQDSIVRKIGTVALPKKSYKGQFGSLNGNKHFKGNKKRTRKPLSYPIEIDQEILVWLLEMMELHLPISLLALRKSSHTAKNLKQTETGKRTCSTRTNLD